MNDGRVNSENTATVAVTASSNINPLPIGAGTFAQEFPSGKFFFINEATGVLEGKANACTGFSVADTTPSGKVLAVGSRSPAVVELDVISGACITLFIAPEEMLAIAVASDGTIVTISREKLFGASQLYRFSPQGVQLSKVAINGVSNVIGLGNLTGAEGIDFGPTDTLYANSNGSLWLLDPITGTGTVKAVAVAGAGDIDIDPTGTLRTINFGVLKAISTSNWATISSRTLERNIFGFSPLVRR